MVGYEQRWWIWMDGILRNGSFRRRLWTRRASNAVTSHRDMTSDRLPMMTAMISGCGPSVLVQCTHSPSKGRG